MKFTQRLAYYLLGLLIGGTIVFYFWQAKGTAEFCYLPNCRVLKDLRSKPLVMTPEAEESMKDFTMKQLQQYLSDGEVDFSQSNVPEDDGKKYVINAIDSLNNPVQIEMINYSERAKLKSIKYLKE